MRYDLLVQQAMQNVVKKVVSDIAEVGHLPGDHHFYITFDTMHPKTDISDKLKEQYPEQMTIVLQHQFWDLKVTEETIEVALSFDQVQEHLIIPLDGLKGFYDPSVNFGLQFETMAQSDQDNISETTTALQANAVGSSDINEADSHGSEETSDQDETVAPKVISLDQFRKKPE